MDCLNCQQKNFASLPTPTKNVMIEKVAGATIWNALGHVHEALSALLVLGREPGCLKQVHITP